jgi:hypothetical protein
MPQDRLLGRPPAQIDAAFRGRALTRAVGGVHICIFLYGTQHAGWRGAVDRRPGPDVPLSKVEENR